MMKFSSSEQGQVANYFLVFQIVCINVFYYAP